jgi:hypothetical protein
MFYQRNRELAVTYDDTPSLTDQSQAHETDINVIVGRMGITGTVPGAPGEPLYGDWTNYPHDLREFIETARTVDTLKEKLPAQLTNMSVEEILALTPDQLTALLADKPDNTETPKE